MIVFAFVGRGRVGKGEGMGGVCGRNGEEEGVTEG